MKCHKVTFLVVVGCAAFVLGDPQAPPDDDDFDFGGSGEVPSWLSGIRSASSTGIDIGIDTSGTSSTTAAPETDAGSPSTTSWSEAELDGSGSGDRSDDEDGDDIYPDEYYDDYEYEEYVYPEEDDGSKSSGSDSSNSSGGSDSNKSSGSDSNKSSGSDRGTSRFNWGDSDLDEADTKKETETKVGVVGSIPPVHEEKPVHSEKKPTLGTGHMPETKPVPVDEDNTHSDHSESKPEVDIVISPEETLREIENELDVVKEREQELERELEQERERHREEEERQRLGEMDGLGTKAVDRDTSFFAQPGILAAVVGGAVVGLLCAILLVMLIVYRMRKKDEGSYPVDEPKRSLTGNSYSKNKEFYA